MSKLLKPPHNTWWWRANGMSNPQSPLDPATLNPAEHYKETGWTASKWTDSVGGSQFEAPTFISEVSINGLKAGQSSGVTTASLKNLVAPKTIQWLSTDTDITLLFSLRINSGTGNGLYLFQWIGIAGTGNLRGYQSTSGVAFAYTDDSANTLTYNVATNLQDDVVHHFAVKMSLVTNNATMDVWMDGVYQGQGVQTTFTPMHLDGIGNTLFNLTSANLGTYMTWCEIILFKKALTPSECVRTTNFQKNKWTV